MVRHDICPEPFPVERLRILTEQMFANMLLDSYLDSSDQVADTPGRTSNVVNAYTSLLIRQLGQAISTDTVEELEEFQVQVERGTCYAEYCSYVQFGSSTFERANTPLSKQRTRLPLLRSANCRVQCKMAISER